MNRQQPLGGGARGFIPLKGRNVGVETPTYKGITSEEVGWTLSPTKSKIAFTLAEVLITLGIIGVVAAMTMPALIQRQNEKATVVKLKKAYSVLENAYRLAKEENGDFSGWFSGTDCVENTKIFAQTMKKYLKVSQDCGFNPGCLPEGNVKHLDGTDYDFGNYNQSTTEYRMVLADGTAIMFYLRSYAYLTCKNDEYCGNIKVLTGNKNSEYKWGKDFFTFNITHNRIIPSGHYEDTVLPFEQFCNITDHRRENGLGCAAWVIFNENMDYLHCSDLSWSGKRTCKK